MLDIPEEKERWQLPFDPIAGVTLRDTLEYEFTSTIQHQTFPPSLFAARPISLINFK